MKNIFVIEDDCIPYYEQEKFVERLIEIKKILDLYNDYDIFLGCANNVFSENIINILNINNEIFVKVKVGYMTNMICYNESSYDFFLSLNPYENFIDKCWHNKLVALIPIPFIAAQMDRYSDIVKLPKSYRGKTITSNKKLIYHIQNNKDLIIKHNFNYI